METISKQSELPHGDSASEVGPQTTTTRFLEILLPSLVNIAYFYAASHDQAAEAARQSWKIRHTCLSYHVPLWKWLSNLRDAMYQLPPITKENEHGIVPATCKAVLDRLEDQLVKPPSYRSSFLKLSWRKRKHNSIQHQKLRTWYSSTSNVPDDEDSISALARSTRLGCPDVVTATEFLQLVEACTRAVRAYLPLKVLTLETGIGESSPSEQYTVWSDAKQFCDGIESVHTQLSDGWECSCSHPHGQLYFAIDPSNPPVDDHVPSTVIHEFSGWRYTSVKMRCVARLNERAVYEDFCHDLQRQSITRSWYTVVESGYGSRPLSFEQLCREFLDPPRIKDRLSMALILSHLYLHLGGGRWWPYERTDQIVQFKRTLSTTAIPVFSFNQDSNGTQDFLKLCVNPAMPGLIEFGRLLLEIVTWRPCPDNEIQQRLHDLRDRDTDVASSDYVFIAITSCLGYSDYRLRSRTKQNTIRTSPTMRKKFTDAVLRNLEYVLSSSYGVNISTILSATEAKATMRPVNPGSECFQKVATTLVDASPVKTVRFLPDTHNTTPPVTHDLPSTNASFTVLNDDTGIQELCNAKVVSQSTEWFNRLRPLQALLIRESEAPIKVAVLDTGVNFHPDAADRYGDRYEAFCFVHNAEHPRLYHADDDGHGTHVTSIVLDVGLNCKVYACRVCEQRNEVRDHKSTRAAAARIAKVIRYAVDIWKVDIISMSFGFRTNPGKIGEAIQYAQSKNTLVFAAAGNSGSLEEVRYPARHPMALCVHAATGHGNTFEGNPTKRGDTSNFALLGVAVRGKVPSDPNEKLRSGTSQATAVAAGVAALILQIMRDHEKETGHLVSHHAYTDAMIQLRQIHGMREVFKSMCNRDKRGEYDIVEPWRLLQDNITPTAVAKHLCAKIVGLMDIRSEDD